MRRSDGMIMENRLGYVIIFMDLLLIDQYRHEDYQVNDVLFKEEKVMM